MNVGDKIKQLRLENGYTLKEFGRKIGMSVSFLSDIENGKSRPSLKRCKEIADGFQVSVSVLLGESHDDRQNGVDSELTVTFESPEGKILARELSDFDQWSNDDKRELIAYLSAKRMIRDNHIT